MKAGLFMLGMFGPSLLNLEHSLCGCESSVGLSMRSRRWKTKRAIEERNYGGAEAA